MKYTYHLVLCMLVCLLALTGAQQAQADDQRIQRPEIVTASDQEGSAIPISGLDMPALSLCDTLRNLGTIPAYPTVSFGHASAALGDTLYIAGGDAAGGASTTFATYCITTGTWGTGAALLEAKAGGDLVACGGSLYYIGGGSSVSVGTQGCYKYTPATGWSAIASIPTAVTGNIAEAWGDSIIFCVAGGWSTYLTTVQVYRVASNTWFTATALPAGRGRRAFAGGLYQNKIYVAAGYSGTFRKDFLIGTIVRADSITWNVGPDVPIRTGATGVSRPGGHAVDGRFYVVCGETTPAPVQQDSIFIWDITGNQWSPTIITGRGATTASNYWGLISSSVVGGKVKIWIPGGALTGVTATPLWVIDACTTTPPVVFNVPDVIYLKFNAGSTTTPNYANPGRGNALATVTGHSIAPGGLFDSTLLGAEGTGGTNWVDNGWAPDLGSGSWTIGFWVSGLHLPTTTGNPCYLFGDPNTAAFRCFWAGAGVGAADTAILLRKTGQTDLRLVLPNSSLNQASYVHFVYDSVTSTIKGYRNGVLGATGTWTAPAVTGSGPFKIAGYSTSANSLVSGAKMDEFRVYSRALDTTEIAQTWNHSLPYSPSTDVREIAGQELPQGFVLEQNYPNPFNPTTTIRYGLPSAANVSIKVFNILGQEVITLVNQQQPAGTFQAVWDGRSSAGNPVASGVYFYSMLARSTDGAKVSSTFRKMIMLK
jgi:hypothetical protein